MSIPRQLRNWALACLAVSAVACEKIIEDPDPNPFDGTDTPITPGDTVNLDPNSIAGLHKNIFSVTCANPGCHDGHFEPDFRTIQSTYSTLVYQPVIKNDTLGTYTYRAIPFNADSSWIRERLVSNDPILGRMPLYAPALSTEKFNQIMTWINQGCKDIKGNPAVYPNLQPVITGRSAFNQNADRIDNNYPSWGQPFTIESSENVELRIHVEDDSTLTRDLATTRIEFSTEMDDFSNATVLNGLTYREGYFRVFFKGSDFPTNQQIWFRAYANDGDHGNDTEYPYLARYWGTKGYYSFIVNP
jgi:hypothetical protein